MAFRADAPLDAIMPTSASFLSKQGPQQSLQSFPWCSTASCMATSLANAMHAGPCPLASVSCPAACQGGRSPAFAVGGAAEGTTSCCPAQCCGHCCHQGSWLNGTAAATASGQDHAHACGPGVCSCGKSVLSMSSAAVMHSGVLERWCDLHCCSLPALAVRSCNMAGDVIAALPCLNLQATVASRLQPSACQGVAKSIQLASKSALLGVLLSTAPQAAAWRRKVTDSACSTVSACVILM